MDATRGFCGARPARATFDGPGATPLDGVIARGLVAGLCVLARRQLAAVPRGTWLAMAVVFAAGVAVRWIDFGGFGETWDEAVNWIPKWCPSSTCSGMELECI